MKVKGWTRTAYDAYCSAFAETNTWVAAFDDLPYLTQAAWTRAALALVDACREWDASGRRVIDDGTVVERDGTPAIDQAAKDAVQ